MAARPLERSDNGRPEPRTACQRADGVGKVQRPAQLWHQTGKKPNIRRFDIAWAGDRCRSRTTRSCGWLKGRRSTQKQGDKQVAWLVLRREGLQRPLPTML